MSQHGLYFAVTDQELADALLVALPADFDCG